MFPQQPVAIDLTRSPMLKVDTTAFDALTPEQVRAKVLVLDFADGSNPFPIMRQFPALISAP